MSSDPVLQQLDAYCQAMPPVAALGAQVVGYDGHRLRMQAPLSRNVNDKGCAFGGSLNSLMTLASWGLVTLELKRAGLSADVFVAESTVRYRAPLYDDLLTEAWLAEGESWDAITKALREGGRVGTFIEACVRLPASPGQDRKGGVAAESRSRFVAIASGGQTTPPAADRPPRSG